MLTCSDTKISLCMLVLLRSDICVCVDVERLLLRFNCIDPVKVNVRNLESSSSLNWKMETSVKHVRGDGLNCPVHNVSMLRGMKLASVRDKWFQVAVLPSKVSQVAVVHYVELG